MLTPTEAFARLARALAPTAADAELIERLRRGVQTRLAHGLAGYRGAFIAGAHARGTAPRPPHAVDLFVELDLPTAPTGGPSLDPHPLLARVALMVGGVVSPPGRRCRLAVRVDFPAWEVSFDVTPAVRGHASWWLPGGDGAWLPTDPARHAEGLAEADRAAGGLLVPLVRLVRHWRRGRAAAGEPLPCAGFHLETMAAEPFRQWFPLPAPPGLPAGLAETFHQLARRVHVGCPDPGGLGPALDGHLPLRVRLRAADQLTEAARVARAALAAERAGDVEQAHLQWRTLLGPAYVFGREASATC